MRKQKETHHARFDGGFADCLDECSAADSARAAMVEVVSS